MLEGGFIIARAHRDADVLRGMAPQASALVEACVAAGREVPNLDLS